MSKPILNHIFVKVRDNIWNSISTLCEFEIVFSFYGWSGDSEQVADSPGSTMGEPDGLGSILFGCEVAH